MIRILVVIGIVTVATLAMSANARSIDETPFDLVHLRVDYNATAHTVGVEFFVDAPGWQDVRIIDPRGVDVFSSTIGSGVPRRGAGADVFLASKAPSVDDGSLEDFLRRFPEGTYTFIGHATDKHRLRGTTSLTHALPSGPEIIGPGTGLKCVGDVPSPVVIEWNPVATSIQGRPIDIMAYEVRIEHDITVVDVRLPVAAGTSVTVPPEILAPGTRYAFDVIAIEHGGNQTSSTGCFVTVP